MLGQRPHVLQSVALQAGRWVRCVDDDAPHTRDASPDRGSDALRKSAVAIWRFLGSAPSGKQPISYVSMHIPKVRLGPATWTGHQPGTAQRARIVYSRQQWE